MKGNFDLVVIGAGPAGLAAATHAARSGLSVVLLDEQPAPGGQIWRSVETVAASSIGDILGPEYQCGAQRVAEFRESGAIYEAGIRVWQIEPGWTIFASRGGEARRFEAKRVLLATGAQERPVPFPGWTTPGVMTVGAAQIVLKSSGEIPTDPVWVAGNGPLPLLYIVQLLRAGGKVGGWLVTTPPGALKRALPHFFPALNGWRDLKKGVGWMRELRRSGVLIEKAVTNLRAEPGADRRLEYIEYTKATGHVSRVPARLLLVHEGLVPSIHMTQALGCTHKWREDQQCLAPEADEWGRTSVRGIYVAGDGSGIGGAAAASTKGELAAIGIAMDSGFVTGEQADSFARPLRGRLSKELATRGLLDSIYRSRDEISSPVDDTIVCRCEELTAGQVRTAAKSGAPSPDRIKSITRAGMGPCQGRQCGYTVAHIIAAVHNKPVAEVGFYRIRPPLKPLTLGELASLENNDCSNNSV
jgi:NADPH-dependent 2,4-dienoyl-CoA reductase/sulfur reductase-like enzyme